MNEQREMSDIVERARSFHGGPPLWAETMHEAADEIERLRRVHDTNVLGYEAEIAQLKTVLRDLYYNEDDPAAMERAHAALEGK